MTRRSPTLHLLVTFKPGGGVPAGLLTDVLTQLDNAVREADREYIRRSLEREPGLPAPLLRKVIDELNAGRGEAIEVRAVVPGSVELMVVATGLGLWLAQKTIGESLGAGWKQSKLHQRLADWVQRFVDGQPARAERALRSLVGRLKEREIVVTLKSPGGGAPGAAGTRIDVRVPPDGPGR